jgi:TPR repeat protein
MWLHAVGGGFKKKLAMMLSHGENQKFSRTQCRMMLRIAQRVASNLIIEALNNVVREADGLFTSGQYVDALGPLRLAANLNHLKSRAHMAWLLINGRKGVIADERTAFMLAEEGSRLGCKDSKGVLAYCYLYGYGCPKDVGRSRLLANDSSDSGSMYGQLALGKLHHHAAARLGKESPKAVDLYRLAAAQGLDEAQNSLGDMYHNGICVPLIYATALKWFQLAAAQGHPSALYSIGIFHQHGFGITVDVAEAIRWYKRAAAAHHYLAPSTLQKLGVCDMP